MSQQHHEQQENINKGASEDQQHKEPDSPQHERYPVMKSENEGHDNQQVDNKHDGTHQNGEQNRAVPEFANSLRTDEGNHLDENEALKHKISRLELTNAKLLEDYSKIKEESQATIKSLKIQVEERNEAIKGVQDGLMKILEEAEIAARQRSEIVEKDLLKAKEEKDALVVELQALKESFQAKEETVRVLETKLEEIQQIARSNATAAERARLEREALFSRLEIANAQIQILESQLSSKFNGTDEAETEKKLKVAESKITDLETRLKVAISQNDADGIQIQSLQSRLATISEEKGDLLGELTQDDDSLHVMTQIHSANAEEIELLRKLVQQHEAKHKQLEQRLVNEISAKTHITRDLDAVKTQLRVKEDEMKSKVNSDSSLLKQKDAKLNEANHTISALQRELDGYKSHPIGGGAVGVHKQTSWSTKVLVPAAVVLIGVGAAYKFGLLRK